MSNISRRDVLKGAVALGAAATLSLSSSPSAMAAGDINIGIVAKVRIPWFDNVEKGVLQAGEELGVNSFMLAPTSDDAAQQVRFVEDLIAQQVDVIGVIPNDGA
ncbi:substrate-binding domain-containing protein, partial [bacterium]|nr:substrate-binding domain-containing protein [bacterium]